MSDRDPTELEALLEAETLVEHGVEHILGSAPIVLEIGFGRGELLLDLAQTDAARSFLGVEVSRKRAVKVARRAQRAALPNLHVVHSTAEFVLERALPARSITECWINFSDPWPKKRHHKRRLFQPRMVAQLARVLEPGGALHVATDHSDYAEWIDVVLSACRALKNMNAPDPWGQTAPERRVTAYEQEWLAEGRRIAYFEYVRSDT